MSREVVVVSAVRTAIGTFGGSLKDQAPTELGALVVRESLARAGVDGKDVGHVVFGHVVNTEPKDMYLSRVAAINGGCAEGTPAFNVNRLCGSGLQAIVSASPEHPAGRHRRGHRRRRRKHEPRTLRQPEHALGRPHGRHQDGRHDGRRAARPLPHHPHGRDGREHRRQVGHHPRRPGQAGGGKPQPRAARHRPRAASRTRSCRWCSRAARAMCPGRPTNTSAPTARWTTWPSSSRCS